MSKAVLQLCHPNELILWNLQPLWNSTWRTQSFYVVILSNFHPLEFMKSTEELYSVLLCPFSSQLNFQRNKSCTWTLQKVLSESLPCLNLLVQVRKFMMETKIQRGGLLYGDMVSLSNFCCYYRILETRQFVRRGIY